MIENSLQKHLSEYSVEQIKEVIFSLVDQYFPVMNEGERQDVILKLLGKSGGDKLSSMVHR